MIHKNTHMQYLSMYFVMKITVSSIVTIFHSTYKDKHSITIISANRITISKLEHAMKNKPTDAHGETYYVHSVIFRNYRSKKARVQVLWGRMKCADAYLIRCDITNYLITVLSEIHSVLTIRLLLCILIIYHFCHAYQITDAQIITFFIWLF